MKFCPGCGKEKEERHFNLNKARSDGLQSICRYCQSGINKGTYKEPGWTRRTADKKKYNREYRLANIEKARNRKTPEQNREQYVRRMKKIHGEDWTPYVSPYTGMTEEEKKNRRNKQSADCHARKHKENAAERQKHRARKRLRMAVARGKVTPLPCFICGEKAEGHHPDYSQPLSVVWLCRKHHREAHDLVKIPKSS